MVRYFLDTGPLLGITFLHDLWRTETERLFATDNTLYTTETVIYEYCNYANETDLEDDTIDLDSKDGKFGKKLAMVEAAQMNLDLKYRSYGESELDLETLVDDFIIEAGIKDSVADEAIEEYIRPRIRSFLEDEIGSRPVTPETGRAAIDTLCNTVINEANEKREMLQDELILRSVPTEERQQFESRLGFVDGYMDTVILSEAGALKQNGVLNRLVTNDSDFYEYRDRIDAVLGLTVLYIKDEFADHSIPEHK